MKVLTKDGKPILVDGKMICVDEVMQIADVTVNGESVVNADGVAEIQYANNSGTIAGVVRVLGTDYRTGISLTELDGKKNVLRTNPAGEARISARNTSVMPIVPTTIDYAVKCALSDGKGAEYTEAEKKASCERIGAEPKKGDWVLKGTLTSADWCGIDLSDCTEVIVKGWIELNDSSTSTILSWSPRNAGIISVPISSSTHAGYFKFHIADVNGRMEFISALSSSNKSPIYLNTRATYYEYLNYSVKEITAFGFEASYASKIADCNIEIYAR